ncbi:MAG: protoporphyrinogen oxidase [Bacteroidetes bacterium]|nr:protoporphyrinogen oxidase [Bacteroidota bacterium]MBU1717865.1 protoporphyrinogen oxidase [Bacteroidota bacterium]
MSNPIEKEIVVIGAGLTGLATTYYLKKRGADFLVLEKETQPGGVIQTVVEGGFTCELGPNTGVLGQIEAVELFEDLGDACILETAGDTAKNRYILKSGKWEPLPSGLWKGIKTPLFTWHDKFRILGEPFRKKGKNPDETLSELVIRRMGKSFLEYAVDPFVLGIYAGDPSYIVPKYALPKLYNLEQEYGSFIKGGFRKGFKKKTPEEKKISRKVFSVKGGLTNLVQALFQKSGIDNFIFSANDVTVNPFDNGFLVSYTDSTGQCCTVKAKKVISTIAASGLDKVLPFIQPSQMEKITSLKYAGVLSAVLGFNKWDGIKPDGFGGLVPEKEQRDILGILYMSTLFNNRAPEGGANFTVFMGGVRHPEVIEKSDDEIISLLEKELYSIMKPQHFSPDMLKLTRYSKAIPQYGKDSRERLETIANLSVRYPDLFIAGNLCGGIGMADRIKQGKNMAEMAAGKK